MRGASDGSSTSGASDGSSTRGASGDAEKVSSADMNGSGSGATYCDRNGVVSKADADAIASSIGGAGAGSAVTLMDGFAAWGRLRMSHASLRCATTSSANTIGSQPVGAGAFDFFRNNPPFFSGALAPAVRN